MFSSGEVTFRVVWKKKSYNVTFPMDEKAIRLKEHIETLTGNFCDRCALPGIYVNFGETSFCIVH